MDSTQPCSPSVIEALHRRHEQVMDAMTVAEERSLAAGRRTSPPSLGIRLNAAASVISKEMDAIQAALLHQVPESWRDALILLYHVRNACDQTIAGTVPSEAADERLQIAIDTLFDFMCCEVDADHGEIGAAFQAEATAVFTTRRLRSGEAEL